MVKDIETPTYLNLALCYIKIEQFHFAIKYATQALENDANNSKALYRRGVAYTKIGEVEKAREDLNEALEIAKADEQEKAAILKALNDVKIKE
jgi:tetratricopeptide (TPR) repeat protein